MQSHFPNVQIGFSRGKTSKQSKECMQTCNLPREGETTYGGSFNQSESTILNLFTTLPYPTRSPREGVRVESKQSRRRSYIQPKMFSLSLKSYEQN